MMMYRQTRVAAKVSAALSIALLTGCGGGGGGGSTTDAAPAPEPDTYVFEVLATPAATVKTSESGVENPSERVAVLDTGLEASHDEFQGTNGVGKPIRTGVKKNVAAIRCLDLSLEGCTDPNDVADDTGHGTAVSSLIAGSTLGYSGNAQISTYDVENSGSNLANVAVIAYGLGEAANDGHRVINLSFEVDPISLRAYFSGSPEGQKMEDFAASGAVLTVAAGNSTSSYSASTMSTDGSTSSWEVDQAKAESMIEQMLVVGALSGDQLANYSSYAGDNALVQERFLVTQDAHSVAVLGNDYGYGRGTSLAAPVVAAGMATMLSKWDHLNPERAARRILDTTDREFAQKNEFGAYGTEASGESSDDYGDMSCGESGSEDCGLYHYGQGRLDLDAAMSPDGVPAVTTAATVDAAQAGNSASIAESSMVASAAMRGVEAQIAKAAGNITVFDAMGRDYQADLSGSIRSLQDPTQSTGWKMSQFMANNALGYAKPIETKNGTIQGFSVDANGRVNMAAIGVETTRLGFTAYHFGNGHSAPTEMGTQQVGMMSFSGNTPMSDQIDEARGFAASFELNDSVSVEGTYWQGENKLSLDKATGDTARMDNIKVGLGFTPIKGVKLTAGYGTLNEDNSFMGTTGMGAFSTENGSSMNLAAIGLDIQKGGFGAFANYQQGAANANFNQGVITNLNGDVEQMAAGLSYGFNAGRSKVAFIASQPMHLSGGEATIKAATGRDKAGNISYEDRRVSFGSADAPRNYEMGFRHQVNQRTMMGFNVMRVENPNNGEAGDVDHSVVGMLSYRF